MPEKWQLAMAKQDYAPRQDAAVDSTRPNADTRANLAAGSEMRQYQAQYLDGDDPVGLMSDTVTVPG